MTKYMERNKILVVDDEEDLCEILQFNLEGLKMGADDYIAKPFSIKEVAARVKAVLKRAGNIALPEKKKTIEIGELTLDLNSKTVYLNEQQILLTKKEFEILSMMSKAPNRVFSREDILGKAWQEDGYVLERTVDVHITRLRKKLGAFGKHIANRSGYGYCLEC